MDKADLKEKVLSNLRAVTLSSKGGVPLSNLERDYKSVVGSFIPYKELNYPTLNAFIKDIPDVIRISKDRDGQLVAKAVADTKTAHIASLVSRQKQTKLSKKPFHKPHVPYVRRSGFTPRYGASRGGSTFHSPNNTSPKQFPPNRFVHNADPVKTSHPSTSSANYSHVPSKRPRPPIQRQKYVPPRFQKKQLQEPNRSPSPPIAASTSLSRTVQPPSSLLSHISLEDEYDIPLMVQPKPLQTASAAKENNLRLLDTAKSAKEYVDMYGRLKDVPVQYTLKKMGQKRKNQTYVCLLQVGKEKYQSYPAEANSEEEASEIAAQAALDDLKKNIENLYILPKTPMSTPEEKKILLSRIEEIVYEKPTGMFERGIESEYVSNFNESLPEGWVDILKESSSFEIEELSVKYGSVPSGVELIIRPSKGPSSGSTTPSETSSKATSELQDLQSEYPNLFPPSEAKEHASPKVPQLSLPDGNEWSVAITNIDDSLAACFVDYSEDFCKLSDQMSGFYEAVQLPVEKVRERQLLAIRDSKNKRLIHRVLVKKVISKDKVHCYYVDEGVFSDVEISELQELHEEFLHLPYQAIHLTLDGLEEYEPFLKREHLEIELLKPMIAVVKKCLKPSSNFFPNDPSIQRMISSVVLYDTDVPEGENDICLNDVVKRNVLQSLDCKLPKIGSSAQCYLTHVDESGEVWLRFLPPVDSWLEIALQQLASSFEAASSEGVSFSPDEVYAAKYNDGSWYRAVVLDTPDSKAENIQVFFIDYGHPSSILKSELCSLAPHSEFLASLPNQAIKCELSNALPFPEAKWTVTALQKLMEYTPFNEQIIVKVLNEGSDVSLPSVILYKRIFTTDDSLIISINDNLANKPELFTSTKPENLPLFLTGQQELGVTSPVNDGLIWLPTPDAIKSPSAVEPMKPLLLPTIPDVGKEWNVFVTIAANPHNFVVQPLDSTNKVDELQIKMQKFYSQEENLIEMEMSMVKLNDFYAALHSDNQWYRVRVMSFLDSETVTVFFEDFGDFNSVSLNKLQILYSDFRTLPSQAIRASLSGIRPLSNDWTPVQCVAFNDLVAEKTFCSIVMHKSVREDLGFPVLHTELLLMDTSDDQNDICINDLLVQQKMAEPIRTTHLYTSQNSLGLHL